MSFSFSMESLWVQTAISAIRIIAFVCDVITFPVYLVLQQPWKRRQLSKRIKVSKNLQIILFYFRIFFRDGLCLIAHCAISLANVFLFFFLLIAIVARFLVAAKMQTENIHLCICTVVNCPKMLDQFAAR